jgi:hypothetical protein
MFRQTSSPGRKAISWLLGLIILWSTFPAFAQQANKPVQAPGFIITPKDVPAGGVSGVTLKLSDESALTDVNAPDIEVESLNPSVITISSQTLTPDKKRLLVTIQVAPEALGSGTLRVLKGNKSTSSMKDMDFVDLNITKFQQNRIPQKPTPNGISRVDVMWGVLPDEIVKENFGSKAAKHYYGIQVAIGNNTGFDLQVVSMGFNTTLKMPETGLAAHRTTSSNGDGSAGKPSDANSNAKPGPLNYPAENFLIPAIDHRLVRGTIEKEQAFGKRAKALGFITGIGTLSSGFLPFFHALSAKANFSTFTSILNGQFREGFNTAVPDLTIRQLNRLENTVMHDQLIISNNGQERTVIFVPKGIFDIDSEAGDKKQPQLNPAQVKKILGELVLVGRPLQYFEDREIIVPSTENNRPTPSLFGSPTPSPTPTPSPSPAPSPTLIQVAPDSGAVNNTREVTLTGTGFVPGAPVKVEFGGTPTTGVALSSTTIRATPPSRPTTGTVDVVVTTADNLKPKLANGYTYLDKLEVLSVDPPTIAAGAITGTTTLTIRGHGFISGAKVKIGENEATNVSISNDHNSMTITLPAHASGKVDVIVTNPDGQVFTLPGGFTYTQ